MGVDVVVMITVIIHAKIMIFHFVITDQTDLAQQDIKMTFCEASVLFNSEIIKTIELPYRYAYGGSFVRTY